MMYIKFRNTDGVIVAKQSESFENLPEDYSQTETDYVFPFGQPLYFYMYLFGEILEVTDESIIEKVASEEFGIINEESLLNTTIINYKSSNPKHYWASKGRFIYQANKPIYAIKALLKCAYSDGGVVRIVDEGNNDTVICEKEFFNRGREIIDLGIISNLPSSDSNFEVQLKANVKDKRVYIDSLTIIY